MTMKDFLRFELKLSLVRVIFQGIVGKFDSNIRDHLFKTSPFFRGGGGGGGPHCRHLHMRGGGGFIFTEV